MYQLNLIFLTLLIFTITLVSISNKKPKKTAKKVSIIFNAINGTLMPSVQVEVIGLKGPKENSVSVESELFKGMNFG